MSTNDKDILALNQKLLNSIASGDFSIYQSLNADDVTCFEPETTGMLVQGLPFHKYYFDLDEATNDDTGAKLPITNITMSCPHVRRLGDNAFVLSYVRLNQCLVDGSPVTKTVSETRIWEKRGDDWKHVHVHKSNPEN